MNERGQGRPLGRDGTPGRTPEDETLAGALRRWADEDGPPAPPVEAMWAAIQEELPPPQRVRPERRRWAATLVAAALAGLLVGRWTAAAPEADVVPQAAPPPAVEALDAAAPLAPAGAGDAGPPGAGALRAAVVGYLLEVGPMLTRLAGGADPAAGTLPGEVRGWASDLLDETRMILDAPGPLDAELIALLEDLEVILAQVAALPAPTPETVRLELEIIAEGMADQRILPRIRTLTEADSEE